MMQHSKLNSLVNIKPDVLFYTDGIVARAGRITRPDLIILMEGISFGSSFSCSNPNILGKFEALPPPPGILTTRGKGDGVFYIRSEPISSLRQAYLTLKNYQ